MLDLTIQVDDPRADDVRALITRHLEFTAVQSPPEDAHALGTDALVHPAVTFFTARRGGLPLGMGALKRLDARHAELKSMHTAAEARGLGLGRAMLDHLLGVARGQGVTRVSLETGSTVAFTPARALYVSAGFTPCPPFGDYVPSRYSTFMTLALD